MHCLTRVQRALSESALRGPYQPNDTTPPHPPPHHHLTCQGPIRQQRFSNGIKLVCHRGKKERELGGSYLTCSCTIIVKYH